MKKLVLKTTKVVVPIMVLFCVLDYAAGFSDRQSIVLAILLVAATWTVAAPKFVPFSVVVTPNLHNILEDFELWPRTDEVWAEFETSGQGISKQHGFSLQFVTRELIYDMERSRFSTAEGLVRTAVEASLEPAVIVLEKPISSGIGTFSHASLTLEGGLSCGFALKLSMLCGGFHWDKVKHKEVFKSIPAVSDQRPLYDQVDIVLARIPREEFDVYYSILEEAYSKAIKRRAEARARFGWKGKAYHYVDYMVHETDADHNDEAEHRYCTVAHHAI